MLRTPWSDAEDVSSQSAYMTDLVKTIDSVVEAVRDHVEKKKYLRNFYDKAARFAFYIVPFLSFGVNVNCDCSA